jgi:hypothetical protein
MIPNFLQIHSIVDLDLDLTDAGLRLSKSSRAFFDFLTFTWTYTIRNAMATTTTTPAAIIPTIISASFLVASWAATSPAMVMVVTEKFVDSAGIVCVFVSPDGTGASLSGIGVVSPGGIREEVSLGGLSVIVSPDGTGVVSLGGMGVVSSTRKGVAVCVRGLCVVDSAAVISDGI